MKSVFTSAFALGLLATLVFLMPRDVTIPTALGAGDSDSCARLEGPTYIGAEGCKKCHFKHNMSWKKTSMAKTFDVLKPGEAKEAKEKAKLDPAKDYTKDATCLGCHTTGYGKEGGYPAMVEGKAWTEEETKRAAMLEGVQCESCHGPGSKTSEYKKDHEDYKKADIMAMGMIAPDKDNCLSCHNDKSPTRPKDKPFDYDALTKDPKKIHAHVPLKKEH